MGDPGDQVVGGGRLDEAGRDGVDADALWGDLVGQALAVGGEGGLGGGVGEGSVPQRHAALDRGDVHDRALAAGDHVRQESTVQTDGGQQVRVQFPGPVVLAERREAAGRCLGSAEGVDEDVDASEAGVHLRDDVGGALRGGQVGFDEGLRLDVVGAAAGGDEHGRTGFGQASGDGGSGAFGAAGDQGAPVFEGFAEGCGHGVPFPGAGMRDPGVGMVHCHSRFDC